MTRVHCAVAFLVTVLGTTAPASAQTSSFRDLPLWLNLNDTVMVRDAQGERLRGRVVDLDPEALVLAIEGEREDSPVRLSAADVTEVLRLGDPVRDGAAVGFGVGAALGVAGWAVEWRHRGNKLPFGYMVLFGGLGAAVGTAVDASSKAEVVVFRRAETAISLSASPSITIRW